MGNLRVFFRSVRFTTRTKRRFLVFVTIFALTAAFIAFFVNTLDGYYTSDYLDQRGVFLQQFDDHNVTAGQGEATLQKIQQVTSVDLDEMQLYRYIDVDPSLRIFSINISRPWMHPWVNPEVVLTGQFPSGTNEVLIPDGDLQIRQTVSNIYMSSTVAVGSKFFFSNGTLSNSNGTSLEFMVSGTFDGSNFGNTQRDTLWIFMDDAMFDRIIQLYGLNAPSAVYTYAARITVKAQGFFPTGVDYDNVATLKDEIETQVLPDTSLGRWEQTAQTSSATVKKEARNRDITSFGFAILGGIILTFMFSYLLSRFRKREVAILKAMGWGKSSIRLTLIAEILTTAMTGFILGMVGANGTLLYLSLRDLNTLRRSAFLRPEAILASFVIIVLVTLPGMMFATFRALRVSPMEAFRDRT